VDNRQLTDGTDNQLRPHQSKVITTSAAAPLNDFEDAYYVRQSRDRHRNQLGMSR
jgi:hypothetical protein